MNEEKKELKKHSDFRKLCQPIKVSKFVYETDREAHFETLNEYFRAIVKVGIPNKLTTMAIPIFHRDLRGSNPAKSVYYCMSPSGVILIYEFKTADLKESDNLE